MAWLRRTNVSNKALELGRFPPVCLSFRPAPHATLLSDVGHIELGHLAGVTGTGLGEWFVQVASVDDGSLGEIGVAGACGGDFVVTVSRE